MCHVSAFEWLTWMNNDKMVAFYWPIWTNGRKGRGETSQERERQRETNLFSPFTTLTAHIIQLPTQSPARTQFSQWKGPWWARNERNSGRLQQPCFPANSLLSNYRFVSPFIPLHYPLKNWTAVQISQLDHWHHIEIRPIVGWQRHTHLFFTFLVGFSPNNHSFPPFWSPSFNPSSF